MGSGIGSTAACATAGRGDMMTLGDASRVAHLPRRLCRRSGQAGRASGSIEEGAVPDLRSLLRLPQHAVHAAGRGHLHRVRLARHDDGERRTGSRTGRRAFAARRSIIPSPRRPSKTSARSATCRWRATSPSSRGARARSSRTSRSAPTIGWTSSPRTACPARCATRSRKDKLGTRESLVGGFVIDTTKTRGEREEYGPFKIENGETRIMHSSSGGYRPTEGEHIRQSELCATCHTLITKALGPDGQVIGSLPEQMPYQEWYASDYREKQSCQNCHMPVVQEPVRITTRSASSAKGVSRHTFVGRQLLHAADAEHVPRRPRRGRAPGRVRSGSDANHRASQGADLEYPFTLPVVLVVPFPAPGSLSGRLQFLRCPPRAGPVVAGVPGESVVLVWRP